MKKAGTMENGTIVKNSSDGDPSLSLFLHKILPPSPAKRKVLTKGSNFDTICLGM